MNINYHEIWKLASEYMNNDQTGYGIYNQSNYFPSIYQGTFTNTAGQFINGQTNQSQVFGYQPYNTFMFMNGTPGTLEIETKQSNGQANLTEGQHNLLQPTITPLDEKLDDPNGTAVQNQIPEDQHAIQGQLMYNPQYYEWHKWNAFVNEFIAKFKSQKKRRAERVKNSRGDFADRLGGPKGDIVLQHSSERSERDLRESSKKLKSLSKPLTPRPSENTDDEIKKWLAARKRNFPTQDNILRKKQEKETAGIMGHKKEELSLLEKKLRKQLKLTDSISIPRQERILRRKQYLAAAITAGERSQMKWGSREENNLGPASNRLETDQPMTDESRLIRIDPGDGTTGIIKPQQPEIEDVNLNREISENNKDAPKINKTMNENPKLSLLKKANNLEDFIHNLEAMEMMKENTIKQYTSNTRDDTYFTRPDYFLPNVYMDQIYAEQSVLLQCFRFMLQEHFFREKPVSRDLKRTGSQEDECESDENSALHFRTKGDNDETQAREDLKSDDNLQSRKSRHYGDKKEDDKGSPHESDTGTDEAENYEEEHDSDDGEEDDLDL